MTTTSTRPASAQQPRTKALPWFAHGVASVVMILVLSLGTWYLLVDPKWSPLNIYPSAFQAVLFWGVISTVWIGFSLEFWGFDRLRQPWRGLAVIAAASVLAIGLTLAFSRGYGQFDPTFSTDRVGGVGYIAGALWVLFGFFFYVTAVVNWGNWPFIKSGLAQPWLGIGQIAILFVPTTVLYLIFGVPAVADWGKTVDPIMSQATIIGWFYSVIVAVVVTGLLTENWPYHLAGSPGRVALASVIGNLIFGTVLYYAMKGLAEVLLGSTNSDALGAGITSYAAQFGVCWVVWMILWQNCFANKPDHLAPTARFTARIVITLALGIVTFLAYHYFIADKVLHEPEVVGNISGNALGWWNWVVIWTLFYVLGLQSWGLPKDSDPDQSDTIAESPGTTATHEESTVHASSTEPVAAHRVGESSTL